MLELKLLSDYIGRVQSCRIQNWFITWSSNGTTLNQTQSWALSLEGAWNTNTINGNTETRTFNAVYETLNSNKNSINSPLTHDSKGNLIQNKDNSLYTWDFENEARKAKFGSLDPIQLKNRYGQVHGCTQHNQLSFSIAGTPSVNASYAYDALGRRVSKTANNTTTIYVSTGYQIASEYKSVNNSAFTESQSYVYASYIDDPLVLINANGRFYYHSNQQFSVSKLTDSNQNIIESYAYNAYGDLKTLTDSSAVDNTYFFTGRQLDSETGLFYFRARYYDAKLGQFISRDPIGYVDGLNMYSGYFALNGVDPRGLGFDLVHGSGVSMVDNLPGTTVVAIGETNPFYTIPIFGVQIYPNFAPAYRPFWNDWLVIWRANRNSMSYVDLNTGWPYTISDPNEVLTNKVKQAAENSSTGCVANLVLIGHGFNGGIATSENPSAGLNAVNSENISRAQAEQLTQNLCSYGTVTLCACFQGNGENLPFVQNLANKLHRKVCACTGAVTRPCNCLGMIVCVEPQSY